MIPIGIAVRLHDPRVLARRPRHEAPEGDPAPDPGRPRPADDLRPRGPRLRRGAGQGRREAQGAPHRGVPAGAGRDPGRQARRDALRDIVPRTEVPALTNFIGAIIQAEQLGVSISKVLQVQSEQLRIERRQRAEEMAAKAPIKMLFPLVGCIFPSLFIVILGPGDHPDHDQPRRARRTAGSRPMATAHAAGVARNLDAIDAARRAAGDGRARCGPSSWASWGRPRRCRPATACGCRPATGST